MKNMKWILVAVVAAAVAYPIFTTMRGEGGTEAADVRGDVVATFGGESLTRAEIDEALSAQLMDLEQQVYDARRAKIEELVQKRLLEKEAEARGVTVTDLMREVLQAGDFTPPPKEEIDAFYEQNKSARAIAGKSREEAEPIIINFFQTQEMRTKRDAFMTELREKADVRIMLEPPRVEVAIPAGEPAKGGPEGAPITIVEFSDFQCGFCRRAEATVDQLMAEYGDKVRIVYRDYTLPNHTRAKPAAMAARCAGDQGKYWEYHGNLFAAAGSFDDADLKQRAEALGLDTEQFNQCYDERAYADAVDRSEEDGSSLGVTGTPTFFINGRRLVGAKPYEEFKTVIDEELARLGAS